MSHGHGLGLRLRDSSSASMPFDGTVHTQVEVELARDGIKVDDGGRSNITALRECPPA